MALTSKTGLYVGRENPAGTPVAATIAFPTKMTFEEKPEFSYPDLDLDSRDENWHRVPGVSKVEWDAKGPWFNDECGYLLCMMLGLPTTTGTSGAYQSVFNPLDTPEALTLYKYLHTDTVQLPYSIATELKLSYEASNKAIDYECKGHSQKATFGQSKPTPAMSGSNKPFAGWLPVVKVGGVSSSIIEMAEFSLTQKVDCFYNIGSQTYTNIYYGKRTLKGKIKCDFTTEDYLNYFKNSTPKSLQFTATGYGIGSGAFNTLDITIPVCYFDQFKFEYGKSNITAELDFTAMHDSVSGRLCQFSLTNLTSSYTS